MLGRRRKVFACRTQARAHTVKSPADLLRKGVPPAGRNNREQRTVPVHFQCIPHLFNSHQSTIPFPHPFIKTIFFKRETVVINTQESWLGV